MKKLYLITLLLMAFAMTATAQNKRMEIAKDDYLNSYLTVESLADNDTVKLRIPAELTAEDMTSVSYSTDGNNWTTVVIDSTVHDITIVLNQGEKAYYKGLGKQVWADDIHNLHFSSTDSYIIYGNIMSLFYGDDFALHTEFPEGSEFSAGALWDYNHHLVSAEHLILPATTIPYYGYWCMFYGCENLTAAPALPATNLSEGCYSYMFGGCSSLTVAPVLPATELANWCYEDMFGGCTSLTEAPALPATTLAEGCYYGMFYECALTTAPALPATTLVPGCYCFMFAYCTALPATCEMHATTVDRYSCYCMYYNCYALETACELPATTMASNCYGYMFADCTALTEAPALPATQLADSCYYTMFAGCVSLTAAPELPATTLTRNCYENMFYYCPSLIEVPELPATTLADCCYRGMFGICTSLTKAPVLRAPVLTEECYSYMFEQCTELHELVCLAIDISAEGCTSGWFLDGSTSGTFYKAPEMEDWPLNSIDGIPTGWTVVNYDGVDDQQDQEVAIYPNPVVDKLHITGKDIQKVKVFDVQGHLVHSQDFNRAEQVEVDFQGCAEGVYAVSIQSEHGNVTRKVVY